MSESNLLDPLKLFPNWRDLPHQRAAMQWWWDNTPPTKQEKFTELWRTPTVDERVAKLIAAVPNDMTFTGSTRRDNARVAVPALLQRCNEYGVTHPDEIAYIMGTVSHECAFAPIREIRANKARDARMWAIQERYWPSGYFGRGYVQITWRENYLKLGRLLNLPLVESPDLALIPENAAAICVVGMQMGLFTNRKLKDFHTPAGYDFHGARRIVNGLDRAALIADYARYYRRVL